ncbi:MAG: hypothetical protein LBR91_00735, partial [Puniceicoccales bacterium]|nr:hypothetical protein [Puniceicoccales bacterium]
EKFWAKLKRKLRDILPLFSSLGDALYHAFFVPFLTGTAIVILSEKSMLFFVKMGIFPPNIVGWDTSVECDSYVTFDRGTPFIVILFDKSTPLNDA